MDHEQMCSYDEAKVPKSYVRRTPRGYLLEAGRTLDPLLLEWFDANLERARDRIDGARGDAVRTVTRAA